MTWQNHRRPSKCLELFQSFRQHIIERITASLRSTFLKAIQSWCPYKMGIFLGTCATSANLLQCQKLCQGKRDKADIQSELSHCKGMLRLTLNYHAPRQSHRVPRKQNSSPHIRLLKWHRLCVPLWPEGQKQSKSWEENKLSVDAHGINRNSWFL